MSQEDKTTFIANIFKLLIGIVLLIACSLYLKSHPAEQTALYSWVKNIVQKVEIFGYNAVGKDWNLLSRKYDLERPRVCWRSPWSIWSFAQGT